MQTITKLLRLIMMIFIMSLCINANSKAQTPADDPGIGGPGTTGSSPAGDGAPIVPFDGGLSLILIASGMGYVIRKGVSGSCLIIKM